MTVSLRASVLTVLFLLLGLGGTLGEARAAALGPLLPTPPVALSPLGGSDPQVAVAPDGSATMIWKVVDVAAYSYVQTVTRPAGSTEFGPVQNVSPTDGMLTGSGAIAVGANGAATITWINYYGHVYQATRASSTSRFGNPEAVVEGAYVFATRPAIAMAPDGTTVIVWRQAVNFFGQVWQATRPAGATSFDPATAVSTTGNAEKPTVAISGTGTTTIGWQTVAGASENYAAAVYAATRLTTATSFGSPQLLSAAVRGQSNPVVAAGADGTTAVAWRGSGVVKVASLDSVADTFGASVTVSAVADEAYETPAIAVGVDGATTVSWYDDRDLVVEATRPAGGSFAAPVDVSSVGDSSSSSSVAIAPDGTTMIIWRVGRTPNRIKVANRPVGDTRFGAPVEVAAGSSLGSSRIGIGGDGSVTLGWTSYVSPRTDVFAVAALPLPVLTVAKAGTGLGSVVSAPAGIDCGAVCSLTVEPGTQVTLMATAASGSEFAGWSGACTGSTATCTVAMTAAQAVTATFDLPAATEAVVVATPTATPAATALVTSTEPAPVAALRSSVACGGAAGCITTGTVPEGATRVVQVATRQVVRGARARTRIVRDCVITTRAGERTYRCELRLPAGRWSVSTEARKGSTVLAKSVRRVTLATPKAVAVKPEAVTG
jgi:hypothetical protein